MSLAITNVEGASMAGFQMKRLGLIHGARAGESAGS